jgi:hypothetical protein
MTGWSAVNASTWSATATAATVPAVTFKNCLRDKNMGHTSSIEGFYQARTTRSKSFDSFLKNYRQHHDQLGRKYSKKVARSE